MLGWILLLKIRDAGVCSVKGSFASCVQHEGESGPEGLSFFPLLSDGAEKV